MFGCRKMYWCNGDHTPHPGGDSLSYADLLGRRVVNHGNAVFLGNDQYICPNEEESAISGEELTKFLCQMRDSLATHGTPSV